MHKLLKYTCDELEELERKAEKGKLSTAELEYADKLAHLKKNILRADELMGEGYSGDSYDSPYDDMRYDGRSFARGRRRDSMGRYSSRYSRRGYSMDGNEMISELRDLMDASPDDRTRQEFQRFISKMEQM
jgi:hypothetical protein